MDVAVTFAKDEDAARQHIQKLRDDWKFQDDGHVDTNHKSCRMAQTYLDHLAFQLYSEENHFLYELIQNADDLDYDGETPTLDLDLYQGSLPRLEIQSNELGFSRENVEAICAAGQSTKVGKPGTIGEKGIGFKSVFRMAHKAWICSRFYSFALETTTPGMGVFGMVIPTWVPNDAAVAQNFGSITTLYLRSRPEENSLLEHFKNFDFTFLLFCQRLKSIQFRLVYSNNKEEIRKGEWINPNLLQTIKPSARGSKKTSYFIHKSEILQMPQEAKRPGAEDTDISLAFPYNEKGAVIQSQATFAFLPIRHYGFDFLIHADFVLTASREDIDASSAWNVRLQNRLPDVIAAACYKMSSASPPTPLSLKWPEYLMCLKDRLHPSFLKPIGVSALEMLSKKKVVKSEDGTFEYPDKSTVVKAGFRDQQGAVLLPSSVLGKAIVSTEYSDTAHDGLGLIGVKKLTLLDFAEALKSFAECQNRKKFQGMPTSWHESVAEAIVEGLNGQDGRTKFCKEVVGVLKEAMIVRLCGGAWTSLSEREVYLLDQNSWAKNIPKDLDLAIIDANAGGAGPSRYSLYEKLKARKCSKEFICQKILNLHSSNKGSALKINRRIDHTVFLFEASHDPTNSKEQPRFYSGGSIYLNTRIYMPFGRPGRLVSDFLSEEHSCIRMLDSAYETAVAKEKRERWYGWLTKWASISSTPPFHENGNLSTAARFVLDTHGSERFLSFLRLCLPDLRADSVSSRTEKWIEEVSQLQVLTTKGGKCRLSECALPSLAPKPQSGELMSFVKLEEPSSPYWKSLRVFGVITEIDVHYHLQRLRCLKKNMDAAVAVSETQLHKVFQDIQKYVGNQSKVVKNAFKAEKLIFANSAWHFPHECVWRADFTCTVFPELQKLYKQSKPLFKDALRIHDATVDTIIAEYSKLDPKDQLQDDARTLLFALDKLLGKTKPSDEQVEELSRRNIFPVWTGTEETGIERDMFSRKDRFYLADRKSFLEAFKGKVWLLDVSVEDVVHRLRHVVEYLDFKGELLTTRVIEEKRESGNTKAHEAMTCRLKDKIPLIIGILAKYHNDPTFHVLLDFESQLKHAQLFRADKIVLQRFMEDDGITDGDKTITGREGRGQVHLDETSDGLNIYVTQLGRHENPFGGELADALAEHLGINEKAKLLFQKVMTSDNLSYLLDKEFLWEGIKPIDDVSQDDNLKDKGSTSCYAESVGEDSDESDIEDDDESDGSQDDQHAQGNSVSYKESQVTSTAGQSASTLRSSASTTSNDEHIALSRLPRASHRRSNARISTGRDVLDDSSTTLEGIAFTAETIEKATTNCRLIDTTPIIPTNRQARLSRRRRSSQNSAGGERVNAADVLVSLMANMNFEADDLEDDEVQRYAMAKTPTSTASQLQTSKVNRLLNSGFVAGRGTRGGRASVDTGEDPLTKQIGFFGELFIFAFLQDLLGSKDFQEDRWTSANRTLKFPRQPFIDAERDFSDFTVSDPEGKLGQHLSERSSHLGSVDSKTTYHLEVKASTDKDLSNPFFMSSNQMKMAMIHSSLGRRDRVPATDVYVVARVYGIVLGGQTHSPKVCFLVDPWRMMLEDSLKFGISGKWTLQVSRLLGN